MNNKRKHPVDMHIIAVDETSCYDLTAIWGENAKYVKAVEGLYLLDKNLGVHICSAESLAECWAVECRAVVDIDCPDDARDEIYNEFLPGGEHVSYMGWETVNPYLEKPLGIRGNFVHNRVPKHWVKDARDLWIEKDRPNDRERCSRSIVFIERLIELHNENSLI